MQPDTDWKCSGDGKSVAGSNDKRNDGSMQGWSFTQYNVHRIRWHSALYVYVYGQWREQSDSPHHSREQCHGSSTDGNGRHLYLCTDKCSGCEYHNMRPGTEWKCSSDGKSAAGGNNKRIDGSMSECSFTKYHFYGNGRNLTLYVYLYVKRRIKSDHHHDHRQQCNACGSYGNYGYLYLCAGECEGCRHDDLQSDADGQCSCDSESVAGYIGNNGQSDSGLQRNGDSLQCNADLRFDIYMGSAGRVDDHLRYDGSKQ
jgi:hypothetical protein